MQAVLDKIFEKMREGSFIAFEDYYYMSLEAKKEDTKLGIKNLKRLSDAIEAKMPYVASERDIHMLFDLHEKELLAAAYDDFESYLLYTEWDRQPKAKFYVPRRKILRPMVTSLQDLADGVLELLCISLPPGVGKTTLAIFFLTWLAGKYPNEPNLTGSYSNSFVRGVYDECLRLIDPLGEYKWGDVFPGMKVSGTNAKDCRIDIDKRQRFETLEFTSIGSGNAGQYRAKRLLYCDDLVSGTEVAFSRERLDKLWEIYTTDLRQRKIGDHCGELHIATRWSVHDIIGRLATEYEGNPKAKFMVAPALNERDESNFDYDYGVGFSTQFYHEQRQIMDDVSWRAIYMNEPIEREGLLYHPDELRRYFELPEGDPDAIIAVCDTKDRGKDFSCLPVAYVWGDDYYIEDVLYDNSLPGIVDARLVEILLRNKVQTCRFESNSAGGRIAEKVQGEIKARGGNTHITTKFTSANKETRIIVGSMWVMEHCLFKDESTFPRGSEYDRFMNALCAYTTAGKNKNDDAPDGIAMLSEFAQSLGGTKIEIFKRPF